MAKSKKTEPEPIPIPKYVPPKVNQLSAKEHAVRILQKGYDRASSLLWYAQHNHSWSYIDWDYVKAELEKQRINAPVPPKQNKLSPDGHAFLVLSQGFDRAAFLLKSAKLRDFDYINWKTVAEILEYAEDLDKTVIWGRAPLAKKFLQYICSDAAKMLALNKNEITDKIKHDGNMLVFILEMLKVIPDKKKK